MSTNTSNINLKKPAMTDVVSTTITELGTNFDTIDAEITKNKNDITITNTTVANNKTNIESQLQTHKDSTSAHDAQNVTYSGTVSGATKVKGALDNLNSRIDNIIINQDLNPNKDAEVIDMRSSSKYGDFSTADTRLEAIETRSKYFAREKHTVLKNNNTITLNHIPENHHELLIHDTKFCCIWEKDIHWNRNSQTITFTEISFSEDFTFVVYNFG